MANPARTLQATKVKNSGAKAASRPPVAIRRFEIMKVGFLTNLTTIMGKVRKNMGGWTKKLEASKTLVAIRRSKINIQDDGIGHHIPYWDRFCIILNVSPADPVSEDAKEEATKEVTWHLIFIAIDAFLQKTTFSNFFHLEEDFYPVPTTSGNGDPTKKPNSCFLSKMGSPAIGAAPTLAKRPCLEIKL